MVSIIVPVYNVEKYIDKCMDSIAAQTYREIEILLINDGSLDGSGELCQNWARKDSRVRYYVQENHGLGYTRNWGVEHANGDYIMFVDSDDWIEPTATEELLEHLIQTNSDMSVCDRFQIKEKTGEKECIVNLTDDVIDVCMKKSCIYEISTSACCKLYKKSLILDNNVREPECYFEDAATPVLIALSKRICHVKKPLYNYVYDRTGSIINSSGFHDHLELYMTYVIEEFKKRGIFEPFYRELQQLIEKRISWSIWNARKNLENDMNCLIDKYDSLCLKNFGEKYTDKNNPDGIRRGFYIWGSYNLMIAAKRVMRMNTTRSPVNHVCFSSMIAAMDEDKKGMLNQYPVNHRIEFRKFHLLNEFKREFLRKNKGEFFEVKYLLIDLLEERFDVGVLDNHYVTISDALSENDMTEEICIHDVLSAKDKFAEWQKACGAFLKKLYTYKEDIKIVLIKMKLCEQYGDENSRHEFDDIEEIRRANSYLEQCYKEFEKQCPAAYVIEVEKDKFYYTDENFRHGCYPWHLNQYMYARLQEKIENVMLKEG